MSNTNNIGNIIILKNGEGAPTNGTLQTAELGFDKSNNNLYIGDKNGDSVLISPRHHSLDTTNYWIQDGTNIDSLVSNGWYSYGENNISTNKPFTYGDIFVLQHGTTNNCCQIAGNRTSNNPSLKVRKLQNGIWSNWYDIYTSTDKIPLTNGGTGQNLSTCPNGALIRNSIDNTGLWYIQSKPGVLYSNATDGIATFGTLPIAYGGTGATTTSDAASAIINNQTISPKSIDIGGSQYWNDSNYGINLNNSDIIKINGLWFADVSASAGEGINFYRSTTSWDRLYAENGSLYFAPNLALDTYPGTRYTIYHSGSTIPIANGGTGATTAAAALTNLGITAKASDINYIASNFIHRFSIAPGETRKVVFSGATSAIITGITSLGQAYGDWFYTGYGTGGISRSHLTEVQSGNLLQLEILAADSVNSTHGFLIKYIESSATTQSDINIDILLISGTLNSYNTTTQTITNPLRRFGETLPSAGIPGRIFYKKVVS